MKKIFACVILFILVFGTSVKTNAQFIKEKVCVGGSNDEYWKKIFYTKDSGKILIGTTNSPMYGYQGGLDLFLVKFSKYDKVEWSKAIGTELDDEFLDLVYSANKNAYYLTYISSNAGKDSIKKIISKVDLNGYEIWQKDNFLPTVYKYNVKSTFNGITQSFSIIENKFDVHFLNNDTIVVFDVKTDSTTKCLGINAAKIAPNGNILLSKFIQFATNPYLYKRYTYDNNPLGDHSNYISVSYNNSQNFAIGFTLRTDKEPNYNSIDYNNYIYTLNNNLDIIRTFNTKAQIPLAGSFISNIVKLPNNNFYIEFGDYNGSSTSSITKIFLNDSLRLLKNYSDTYKIFGKSKTYIINNSLICLNTTFKILPTTETYNKFIKFDFDGNSLINKTLHYEPGVSYSNGNSTNYFALDVIKTISGFMYLSKKVSPFSNRSNVDTLFSIDFNGNTVSKVALDTSISYNGVQYRSNGFTPKQEIIPNLEKNDTTGIQFFLYSNTCTPDKRTNLYGKINYSFNGNKTSFKYGETPRSVGYYLFFNFNGDELVDYFDLNNAFTGCLGKDITLYIIDSKSSTIKGIAFIDNNNNNLYNAGTDILYTQGYTKSTKQNINQMAYLNTIGEYAHAVDTGTYNTTFIGYNNYYTITPISKTTTHAIYGFIDTVDFVLKPKGNIKDLRVTLVNTWVTRPGFTNSYEAVYVNEGTTAVNNASVAVVLDNRLTYNSAVPTPTAIFGDTLKWNLASLNPTQEGKIKINFTGKVPPTLNGNDSLLSNAIIYPVIGDTTPIDNNYTLTDIARNAFDPNDKNIEANANLTPTQISNGDYITYRVRFQNKGNFYATNVIIKDTLESNLDWSSLQVIAASHTGLQTSISGNNIVEFKFNNINLPASSVNELASHGYIIFKIKPKNNLVAGNTIKNTAHITFDFNTPIKTTTAIAKVSTVTSTINKHNTIGELNLYPNPNNGNFTIDFVSKGNYPITISLFDVTGKMVYQQNVQHNNQSLIQISDAVLASGLYNIQISSTNDVWNKKVMITK